MEQESIVCRWSYEKNEARDDELSSSNCQCRIF